MYVRIWAFALSAYQMLCKIGSKSGANMEVLMPVRAIATPPMASCTGLTLAQALVPEAVAGGADSEAGSQMAFDSQKTQQLVIEG